ncbi:MAG: putative ribose-5-phosphate isomerase B [Candidatus Parcubacteria bacterium]|nr:MAG: putative ribose-5-phosphate isomerase B [Candidatus Parcubacteria bacterium]
MKIFLGADHRGFELKEFIKKELLRKKIEIIDCGAYFYDPNDDYVDFAIKVGESVIRNKNSLGILICGSGAGVCFSVNKVKGIRGALCYNEEMVKKAKEDDDINVICLASDFIDSEKALKMIDVFLTTNFKNEEKYLRRINKIKNYENGSSSNPFC